MCLDNNELLVDVTEKPSSFTRRWRIFYYCAFGCFNNFVSFIFNVVDSFDSLIQGANVFLTIQVDTACA